MPIQNIATEDEADMLFLDSACHNTVFSIAAEFVPVKGLHDTLLFMFSFN